MSRPGIFGPPRDWPAQDLIGLSDELDPDLVVLAYRCGVFPMPLHNSWFPARMGWWSPMRRGVLLPDLAGVDTVDEQIAIARRKGNIGAKEKVTLWRFEVTRHV